MLSSSGKADIPDSPLIYKTQLLESETLKINNFAHSWDANKERFYYSYHQCHQFRLQPVFIIKKKTNKSKLETLKILELLNLTRSNQIKSRLKKNQLGNEYSKQQTPYFIINKKTNKSKLQTLKILELLNLTQVIKSNQDINSVTII